MDNFIFLLILMGVAALLEQIFKAVQKGKASQSEMGGEPETEAGVRSSTLPEDLQDLISEELGINLERRPRVEGEATGVRTAEYEEEYDDSSRQRREESDPYRPEAQRPHVRRSGSEWRARRAGPPARSGRPPVRPGRPARPTRPMPEPVEITPAGPVISLEEQGILERGEAVSLETARTPEDHRRFHRLYMEVEEEAPKRRSRGGRLPNRRNWSPVHQAIVWSEIIGPPKGLTE